MDYEDDFGDEGEARAGQFNDARGQAIRLHELAQRIIDSKTSPFIINMDFGIMNYQLRISSLDALWQEVRPKCEPEEINTINAIRELINKTQIAFPVITENNNGRKIDIEHWAKLDKLLVFYEEKIRKLQDEHQLGNPTKRPYIGL